MSKPEIQKTLDGLVGELAAIVSSGDAASSEKTAAFKALTAYYALRFKKDPPSDGKPAGANFSSFVDDIAEASNGGATVRASGRA